MFAQVDQILARAPRTLLADTLGLAALAVLIVAGLALPAFA